MGRPRAWPRWPAVALPRRQTWSVAGVPIGDEIPTEDSSKYPATVPVDHNASMAMSPDGSLVATIVGHAVRVSVVCPSGEARPWGSDAKLPDGLDGSRRVLALSEKGDEEVWCAVVATATMRLGTVRRNRTPQWKQVFEWSKAVGSAAFWNRGLLLVPVETVDNNRPPARHYSLTFSTQAIREPNAEENVHKEISAVDVAVVGGRPFLCLLAKGCDDHRHEPDETRLVVIAAGRERWHRVREIDPHFEYLKVVRDPLRRPESVCILAAGRRDDQATTFVVPHDRGDGDSAETAWGEQYPRWLTGILDWLADPKVGKAVPQPDGDGEAV